MNVSTKHEIFIEGDRERSRQLIFVLINHWAKFGKETVEHQQKSIWMHPHIEKNII